MLEILLVFSVNGAMNEVSDRIFTSYQECTEFVNTIASQPVVETDMSFDFLSIDGIRFQGQCVEKNDYIEQKGT